MMENKDLHGFLVGAELQHYYSALKNELKITTIQQLKYVDEADLHDVGMTKPEMRRLKKFYRKEFPAGPVGKLKKVFSKSAADHPNRSISPSPPEKRISRPISFIRPVSKQIISADNIAVNKTLGEGEFGIVQQGVWTTEEGDKVQVALKCLSKERMHNGTAEFLKEASLMQTIDHENIVRMFGVVLDKDQYMMLVTELAPMRSLLECLKEVSLHIDFPIPRLCDFAQQICDGMSYLESKRLIHRDLAARNILVFSKKRVKISDFGLSRALGVGKDYYQSNFSINLKLPIAWCAPECINYLKFTSASDIWSFGVTLWELFTYGFQPWAGMTGQQILEAIDEPNFQRLEKPDLCPVEFYNLMTKCWEQDPGNRPTFSELFIKIPQIRPVQLKAVKDSMYNEKEYLHYKSYDVIVVIDKRPSNPPIPGMWIGANSAGKSGFFDPTNGVPFIEPVESPIVGSGTKLVRKESKKSSKLRTDMISRPQSDLRHTGHIGYDGAIFGDVSFIGDNYDKLPVKVMSTNKMDDAQSSSLSLTRSSPERNSDFEFHNHRTANGLNNSWWSQDSLDSSMTMQSDGVDGDRTPHYTDIDDDALSDFKMPDLSSSLDFGPSFLDDVLKALNENEKKLENASDKASLASDKTSSSSKEDHTRFDRSLSRSPPSPTSPFSISRDAKPPPLPSVPPRMESRKESKAESKKQAKVKPMSSSEAKMIDSAIALANEFDEKCTRSQKIDDTPTTPPLAQPEVENGLDSPTSIISKLKFSIKRSPKTERKQTFSEAMENKANDELPPEAQEAYNMLVVHGAASENGHSESITGALRSRRSPPTSPHSQSFTSISHSPPPLFSRRSESPETRPHITMRQNSQSPKPAPRVKVEVKKSEIPVPKPRPEVQRVEPTVRQITDSYDSNIFSPQLRIEEKSDSFEKVDNSEPLELLHIDESTDEEKVSNKSFDEKKTESLTLSVSEDKETNFEKDEFKDSARSGIPVPVSGRREDVKVNSIDNTKGFSEEFSEPSPREIMSRLARESRLRRSLDHQGRVDLGDSSATNRNLREPQGIPGKSVSSSSTNEEEVDTNPLRMLRGGAIPIRASRTVPGKRTVRK